MPLPVIDLSGLGPCGMTQQVADDITHSFIERGFAAIVGHGIPADLFESVQSAFGEFLALPADVKAPHKEDPKLFAEHRRSTVLRFAGYATGDPIEPADTLHEPTDIWYMQRGHSAGEVSLWPSTLPGFQRHAASLFASYDDCCNTILRGLALGLGEPEERLVELCAGGWAMLRLLHSPPLPSRAPAEGQRAIAHEDTSVVTLYGGATTAGLELRLPNGSWYAAPAGCEVVVAAAGDVMPWLTNGLVRAVTHRVVFSNSSSGSRKSNPFGVLPRLDSHLTALESCVRRTGGVPKYERATVAQILDSVRDKKRAASSPGERPPG